MGLVLDSGVLIAAEREAQPVSSLLATLEQEHGEAEIVMAAITVMELEHGRIGRGMPRWRGSAGNTWTRFSQRFLFNR
jgi:predicted nucleic acid-binding protein